MKFSKIDYNNQSEEIFNVKIEDNTGQVLDKWKFNKKDFSNWANIIIKKFGLNVKIKNRSDLDWTDH